VDAAARVGTLLTAAEDATAPTEEEARLPLPHLVTCRNYQTCGGCAPKACCRFGGTRACTGTCCHRHCCKKPCEHTGPCPGSDEGEATTGVSHEAVRTRGDDQSHSERAHHEHDHAGGEGCTHDHGHGDDHAGGEGCTHDHGHGDDHAGDEGCTHNHGHGHGGMCCNDQSHSEHAHHEHDHGGVPCTHDHAIDGYDLNLASPMVAAWSEAGASVLWVVVDDELAAAVQVAELSAACQLSDQIRVETAPAMRALEQLGVATIMLTGDAEVTAQAVRVQAGISSAVAGMLPEEKLDAVRRLAAEGVVGMIGDGINDGPALAAADVGIAMGVGGTALASQAAGVILMTNDLRRVADAVVGARLTTRVLKTSVALALLLKLLPLVLIFALPDEAEGFLVAAAVGSDLLGIALVLLLAMSLLRAKPKFATTPCGNSDNSMEGPAVVTIRSEQHA